MVGIVGQVSNSVGGYLTSNKTDTGLEFNNIPSGSKILCTSCELDNESTLISEGNVIKTDYGYNIEKDSTVTIIKEDTVPLTILCGRELLYVEKVVSGTDTIFNLPKGSRVNKAIVSSTGEFTTVSSNKYLIEY